MSTTTNGGTFVNGTPVDGVTRLQERLSEPATVAALNRILDNVELIAFAVTAADQFLRRSETVADNMAGGLADLRAVAPAESGQALQSLFQLLPLLPKLVDLTTQLVALAETAEMQKTLSMLGDPEFQRGIQQLTAHMDLIVFAISALDGFLRRSETLIDNVSGGIAEFKQITPPAALDNLAQVLPELLAATPQWVAMLPTLQDVVFRLQPMLDSPEFKALLTSGVFSPKTLNIIGEAGNALVESYEAHQQEPKRVGIWGLIRLTSDPDIQRALGFLADFGRRFGQKLS